MKREERHTLVDALLACPSINDRKRRDNIIAELSNDIKRQTSISKVFRVKTTCQTSYDRFLAVATFLTTTTSVNGSVMGVQWECPGSGAQMTPDSKH